MFSKIWKKRRHHKDFENWSGRWESNPRPKLGKLLYCHCTTPAQDLNLTNLSCRCKKSSSILSLLLVGETLAWFRYDARPLPALCGFGGWFGVQRPAGFYREI